MVYDSHRKYCVMFGGQDSANGFLGDTWTYADSRWERLKADWWLRPQPMARCGHALAFDEQNGVTVLFGGIDSKDTSLGDTWILENGAWSRVPGVGPTTRRYAAFAYDPELKGCVLHGGSVDDQGRVGFCDSWLFRNGAWSQLVKEFDTDVRDDHGLGYHRKAQRLVMLEGLGGASGLLVRTARGWEHVEAKSPPPRHQCSPLVWDRELDGLVLHGGEARHGGPQFETTLVLRLTSGESRTA
jgi:hypothetical protein